MRRLIIWLVLCLSAGIASAAGVGPSVFINEIHYDNTGTDTGEFIEIAGPAGTNLAGWSIELYNGSGGARYDVDALSGTIPNQQNGFGTVSISYPSNGIQNGSPDGIALVNGTTVIQFLSYEGTFTATSHTANGMTSTDIGVSENGSEAVGLSLQLQGTGTTYDEFAWASPITNTQNAVNTGQTFGGTPVITLSINDVAVLEGNVGATTSATFTVLLSSPAGPAGVSFDIATQDNSATFSDGDYVQRSLTAQSIPTGATSYTFAVTVNGDSTVELSETFFVNVTNVAGAVAGDTQGVGTIVNDDTPPVVRDVIINEIDSDTPSTDAAEFVELYDGGVGNTPLDGLVVVFYNGSNDLSYASFDLDGRSTDANGYFTLGNAAVPGVDAVFSNNLLQNGQDAVALYSGNASGFPNGSPITTLNLIDAVVYGTDDPDDPGLQVLLNPGEPQVNENAGGQGVNNSIQRCPNGSGGARDTSAYTARTPSPDGANNCPPPPPPAVARSIHEIQSDMSASPFVGTDVITTGVVTLLKANGFFLQTPDLEADSNPNTSQGIFVFTSVTPAVAVGDFASVTGQVDEFFTLTQVRAQAGGITVTSTGNTLPSPVTLTSTLPSASGAPDQLERLEGMRVHADALTSVAPTDFGETFVVVQGVARPMREPGIEASDPLPPGAPCCIPRFDQNPEKFAVDSDGRLGSIAINVTSGVTFSGVTGPLDFSFGQYMIVTETDPGVTANASPTPVPDPGANEFTIASFNIENFFLSSGNFATKVSKASLAVRNAAKSPDIIGTEEVGDLATLTALAERINADAVAAGQPNPGYQAHLLEGDDAFENDIDVGFLIKTSRVTFVSVTQEGKGLKFTDPTDGSLDTLFERPPLVLRAGIRRPGASDFPVSVIVNHPQSLIDVDDPVRGPRQREKRRLQAEFTANLAQRLQGENLVLVGDFNSYQFSDGYVDVIGTITGNPAPADQVLVASPDLVNPNLTDLIETLPAQQRYSFVFEGNAQVLDHVLTNDAMLARRSRVAYARVNADFPETPFSLDPTRPERVSDHDIPVAYFTLPAPIADLSVTKSGPAQAVTGTTVTYTVTVENHGPDPAANVKVTDATAGTISGPAGWTCTTTTCSATSLAAGSTATFTITAELACATSDGAIVSNTASASSAWTDPNPADNSATAVVIASNPPPVINGLSVDKPVLNPPNHKMVDVALTYGLSDNCGPVVVSLAISSNEPEDGTGDGDTGPDWEIVSLNQVRLRAERAGTGDGRTYTITVTATDSAGGSSSQIVTVKVSRNN